jgi:DHA1 family bicyclomycin/chloramphenicol resistance-like MFS transporter
MSRVLSEKTPHAPLWLLALMVFSGTLGMHIFVPALPSAAVDLGASAGTMQWAVTLYILGLAAGQLVYGPLSDRYGRRSVLMGGLALYTVSGLAAALAPQAHALVLARLFQAFGGCAGLVLGRAIVRDTAAPGEAAKRLALMNLMVTVGPSVAPLVGGLLASGFGWRSVFYFLFALGLTGLVCSWLLLPETSQPGANTNVRVLMRNYGQLLASPAFLGYSVGGGCATTSMYAFIAAAPFIFVDQLHRSIHEASICIALLVSGIWLGSALTSHLISKVSVEKLLVRANLASVVSAAVFLAGVLSGHLSVVFTIVTIFVFTVGVGMAAPTALTQAISVDPRVIGSASGLYGFAQMTVGAFCTSLAALGSNPALAAGLVLTGAGIVAQLSFWVASRRMRQQVAEVA